MRFGTVSINQVTFYGCDSSETCQLLLIRFFKEFKLDAALCGQRFSAIHHALLHRLFVVVKFLVKESKVDVNQPIRGGILHGGTPLHIAYAIMDEDVADYLIEQGANCNATDSSGKKPQDYLLEKEDNDYYKMSISFVKHSKKLPSEGLAYFMKLCNNGIPIEWYS